MEDEYAFVKHNIFSLNKAQEFGYNINGLSLIKYVKKLKFI